MTDRPLHLELATVEGRQAVIGRDPRRMSAAELNALGHHKRSLLRVIRENCIGCCAGHEAEVRSAKPSRRCWSGYMLIVAAVMPTVRRAGACKAAQALRARSSGMTSHSLHRPALRHAGHASGRIAVAVASLRRWRAAGRPPGGGRHPNGTAGEVSTGPYLMAQKIPGRLSVYTTAYTDASWP